MHHRPNTYANLFWPWRSKKNEVTQVQKLTFVISDCEPVMQALMFSTCPNFARRTPTIPLVYKGPSLLLQITSKQQDRVKNARNKPTAKKTLCDTNMKSFAVLSAAVVAAATCVAAGSEVHNKKKTSVESSTFVTDFF